MLAWLGAVSYTLYLLHENIGWGIILQLEHKGISSNLSVLIAIAVVLGMASLLTSLIEKPAMRELRERYRRAAIPPLGWRRPLAAAFILLLALAGLAKAWHSAHPRQQFPVALIENIQRPKMLSAEPCSFASEPRPLMILVLGQSNAGNHGEQNANAQLKQATYFSDGNCFRTSGPAPGATGTGGNIWAFLHSELARTLDRPVVFAVLAVESTRLRDWILPGMLRDTLFLTLFDHRRHGFVPDIVLWQQGEADARIGITQVKYQEQLVRLVSLLRGQSISAPIIVALSTVCGNEGSENIRRAIRAAARMDSSILVGPDTDAIAITDRKDGCHYSRTGLRKVAQLWHDSLSEFVHFKE